MLMRPTAFNPRPSRALRRGSPGCIASTGFVVQAGHLLHDWEPIAPEALPDEDRAPFPREARPGLKFSRMHDLGR